MLLGGHPLYLATGLAMQRYVGQDVPRTDKRLIDSQLQNDIQSATSLAPAPANRWISVMTFRHDLLNEKVHKWQLRVPRWINSW